MTLRKGFITTAPTVTGYDQLWRLFPQDMADAQIGKRVFTEYLYGVDHDHSEAIMTQLQAVDSVTNPIINGQTVTGKFACSKIVIKPTDSDGDTRIYRTLTEVKDVTDPIDLDELTPYLLRENEITEPFYFYNGELDTFTITFTNISRDSRNACMVITDADIVAYVNGLDDTVTWTYVDRKFEEQTDNTAHLIIIVRVYEWLGRWAEPENGLTGEEEVTKYTKDLTNSRTTEDLKANKGGSGIETVQIAPGISKANADTDMPAITPDGPVLDPTTSAVLIPGNVIGSVSVSANSQTGARQLELTQKVCYTGTDDTDALVILIQPTIDRKKAQCHRIWWRRTYEAMITLTTSGGEALRSFTYDGTDYPYGGVRIEDNHDTTFNVTEIGEDPESNDSNDGWGETIIGFITWVNNQAKAVLVFKKCFADVGSTEQGRETYMGAVATPIRNGGISTRVKDMCNNDFVTNWEIVGGAAGYRTGEQNKSSGIVECTRVEVWCPYGI
jgi:hypothetical protein